MVLSFAVVANAFLVKLVPSIARSRPMSPEVRQEPNRSFHGAASNCETWGLFRVTSNLPRIACVTDLAIK